MLANIILFIYSILVLYIGWIYAACHFVPSFDILKYLFLIAFFVASHNAGAVFLAPVISEDAMNYRMRSLLFVALGFQVIAALVMLLFAFGLAGRVSFSIIIIILLAAVPLLAAMILFFPSLAAGAVGRMRRGVMPAFKFSEFAPEFFIGIDSLRKWPWYAVIFDTAVFLLTAFALIFSALPQTGWDALSYQMEIPRRYILEGGMNFMPEIYFWGYPQLLNMIYSVFIMFGFDTLCSTFHALFVPLTALFIINFPSKLPAGHFGATVRKFAVLLVCSHPQIVMMASYAFVDLGLAFYFTGAMLFAATGMAVPAAVFMGGALSVKYTGLVMTAILFIAMILFYRCGTVRVRLNMAALTVFIALALFSPYCIKNFAFTGNPLYPFFKDVFVTETQYYYNLESYLEVLNRIGREKTLANFIVFPYTITVDSQFYGIRCYDGVMGITFLILIPFFIYGLYSIARFEFNTRNASGDCGDSGRPRFAWCIFFIFIAFYIFVLRAQSTRYFLPVLPVYYLISAEGIKIFLLRTSIIRVRLVPAAMIGVFFLFFNASPAAMEFVKKEPLKYLCGMETGEEFLCRNLPLYHCARHYNYIAANSTGEVVLAPLYEPRTYYFTGKYIWSDVFEPTPFENIENLNADGELIDSFPHVSAGDLKKYLISKKITHILLSEKSKKFFLEYLIEPRKISVFEKFIGEYCELLTEKNGYSLYSIKL